MSDFARSTTNPSSATEGALHAASLLRTVLTTQHLRDYIRRWREEHNAALRSDPTVEPLERRKDVALKALKFTFSTLFSFIDAAAALGGGGGPVERASTRQRAAAVRVWITLDHRGEPRLLVTPRRVSKLAV